MALPQAPKRQDNRTFPTPLVGDILFSQIEDCSRINMPSYGTPHPDTAKWPSHKLVYIRPVDNARDGIYEFFYAADRSNQDTYNWEFTKANIGGQAFDAVQRTYVTPRASFTPATPAMGSAMPNTPASLFTGSYVLAERKQGRIGDQVLDSLYVVDVHVYVKRCTLTNIGTDELNGKALYSTETLYYATEVITGGLTSSALFADPTNAYWGLQTDGTERSGRQISCEWYAITVKQVVSGTIADGIVAVSSYNTTQRYYWPAVLGTFELMSWVRNDGGTDVFPRYTFAPDAYNGACKALVERSWSKSPQTLSTIVQMLPTPVTYACPYFTMAIPECLHPVVTAKCDTGSSDPIYVLNTGSTRTIPATNYTSWPSSIVASDEQDPYRGGYLRTKVTIYKPA
jgi:hypothetical protein